MCINRGVQVAEPNPANGEHPPMSGDQTRRTKPGICRPEPQSQYLYRPSVAINPANFRGLAGQNKNPGQNESHSHASGARPTKVPTRAPSYTSSMPTTQSQQQNPACPRCHSKFTIKKGKRKNRLRALQVFQCSECLYKFNQSASQRAPQETADSRALCFFHRSHAVSQPRASAIFNAPLIIRATVDGSMLSFLATSLWLNPSAQCLPACLI
jgi:ribosomal protein L37AE/L43A